MRRINLCMFALVLSLSLLVASCALSEEIDVLGEWYMYPFFEENRMTAFEPEDGIIKYRDGSKTEYKKTENGVTVLFPDDDEEHFLELYAYNDDYTVMTFGEDAGYAVLSKRLPEADNGKVYGFYEIEKKTTVLFTESKMISSGINNEYLLNRGVLYVLSDDGYEKGVVEIISDKALIWHIESDEINENGRTFHYAILLIRW